MKTWIKTLSASLLLTLTIAGCASAPPLPGESHQQVISRLGKPSAVYSVQGDTVLEYATGPFGQLTYMARIGPDGRLTSYEQVLTDAKFATVKVGITTREDVLHTFGRPAERSYLSLPKLEVWSYRYQQSGVWDAMMHVHFDHDGIVRMMQSGPDEERQERRSFFR
jgi:outer membrane protein assembly factor BamE (lipoprotein component of BamABCDE complex)